MQRLRHPLRNTPPAQALRRGPNHARNVALGCMSMVLAAMTLAALRPSDAAADPLPPCTTVVTTPRDGASAVPVDIVLEGSATCIPEQPTFVDEDGAKVDVEFTVTGVDFTLRPTSPLQPDRRYDLQFTQHGVNACAGRSGMMSFTTAAKPSLRKIRAEGLGSTIDALTIEFSEPVLDPADLQGAAQLFDVALAGIVASPKVSADSDGRSVQLSYKGQAKRPTVGSVATIRLREGLRFASGAVLDGDVVVKIPLFRNGDLLTGGMLLQPCETDTLGGCSASSGAPSPLAALVLVCVALALLALRRASGKDVS